MSFFAEQDSEWIFWYCVSLFSCSVPPLKRKMEVFCTRIYLFCGSEFAALATAPAWFQLWLRLRRSGLCINISSVSSSVCDFFILFFHFLHLLPPIVTSSEERWEDQKWQIERSEVRVLHGADILSNVLGQSVSQSTSTPVWTRWGVGGATIRNSSDSRSSCLAELIWELIDSIWAQPGDTKSCDIISIRSGTLPSLRNCPICIINAKMLAWLDLCAFPVNAIGCSLSPLPFKVIEVKKVLSHLFAPVWIAILML